MFKLAHISDIHLGPLPDVTYRELLSKRITGYINWRRNRKGQLHEGVLDTIVANMLATRPDHIAVTGDLMNLALDGEIELSRLWLETLGSPENVSIVPGNHDAYVPGALAKASRAWSRWMRGDSDVEAAHGSSFPYMRVRGPLAIIGVSSARATAPFLASGFFSGTQGRRLGQLLDEARKRGLFRVILIHHPPVRGATATHKRLYGIGRFQRVIEAHGAELVLHGHTHKPTLFEIAGQDGTVPVIGVTPPAQALSDKAPPAQYNLFEITGSSDGWHADLTRHGLEGSLDNVAPLLSARLDIPRAHAPATTAERDRSGAARQVQG